MDELLDAVLEDLWLASEIEPDRGYIKEGDRIRIEGYREDGTPYHAGYLALIDE